MKPNYSDIVIIGAGLSGIGAGCHLTLKNPDKSFVILESEGLPIQKAQKEYFNETNTNVGATLRGCPSSL